MIALDIDELRRWIGRTELARDLVTPRLVSALNATLNKPAELPADGATAPVTLHWCLTRPIAEAEKIGEDGHPARGDFLPPIPLPRRMWAGSQLQFHALLRVGDPVERRSRLVDVAVKEGRSGRLCFVTVDHEYFVPAGIAISERQDVVYRDPPAGTVAPAPAAHPKALDVIWHRAMQADPVLLFRYSALTFNSHRIHYDHPYATGIEGYPGLLVHGPLQATWLAEFAETILERPLRAFSFRGVQPLFEFNDFRLCAGNEADRLHLWIETDAGAVTMDAWAA